MTGERWERIQEVLLAALGQPPDERQAFVEAACDGDDALRAEVVSLLEAHAETGPADRLADALLTPLAARLRTRQAARERVGPYRIVEEVGRGGMGAVYRARREDGQFDQEVALKLLRSEMATADLVRRFLQERQVLARLQHAHIARLLDGGLTDEGQPYFAMEYVDGQPITDYCDERRLSVEERLALFQDVCKAVQYAHQNLVVHRDLKPSNILVTEGGEVKLLDFGIAKLLAEENDEMAPTVTGRRWMTPQYASPEQILGETVTTASDVYSLGVVLYELLAGHHPYPVAGRSPHEVERAILEADPVRPSTAVGRTEPAASADGTTVTMAPDHVGAARRTEVQRLRRRLSGDLDTIVLRALSKEPARRYASAEAFVEDVRRHLAGLPVLARRDTPGYRLRTFVRRHRAGVAVAALAGLAVVAAFVGMAWQARVATQERDRARLEAAKAEQVTEFVVGLFELADPASAQGDTLTVHTLLDRGAARIRLELEAQPAVQAEMMDVMGRVYRSLGLFDRADPLVREALAQRQTLYAEAHEDVAQSLHHLGALRYDQSDYEAAAARLREAVALYGALPPEQRAARREEALAAQQLLADVLSGKGELGEAEALLRRVLAEQGRLSGPAHADVQATLRSLALVLHRKGDYAAAEELFRQAVEQRAPAPGGLSPAFIDNQLGLARLLRFRREHAEAEALLQEALDGALALYGDAHPTVATLYNERAQVTRDAGDYERAEAFARSALGIWQRVFGDEHRETAISKGTLVTILRARGAYAEAESLARGQLATMKKIHGEGHMSTLSAAYRLGSILLDQGRVDEAHARYQETLATSREHLGEEHVMGVYGLQGLADVELKKERPAKAEPFLREALALRQRLHDERHWRIAQAQSELAACLMTLGQYEEAEALLRSSHRVLLDERGADDPETQKAAARLEAVAEGLGR